MQHREKLRPQDVLVACKIYSLGAGRAECTYVVLGKALGMSTSTAHEAVSRCRQSLLLPPTGWTVNARHLRDLLVVGVPRIFYAVKGDLVRGTVTSTRASVFAGKFRLPVDGGMPVVWCEDDAPEGLELGAGLAPVYPTAPAACRSDPVLYELLALVDVMRVGTEAEREVATSLTDRRLGLPR